MLVGVWRNWNPCTLLVEMQKGTAAMEDSMEVLQKLKYNCHLFQQSHFWVLTWIIEIRSWRNIKIPMFISGLFTIPKMWKQPKCLSKMNWLKKKWGIYITHSRILLSLNERNPAMCGNMNEPWGRCARWASHRRTGVTWFHLCEVWNSPIHRIRE